MSDSYNTREIKLFKFSTSSKKQPAIKSNKENRLQQLIEIHKQKVLNHQQIVNMHQQPKVPALSVVDTTYSDKAGPAFNPPTKSKETDSDQEVINKILLEQQTSLKRCYKLEIEALKKTHETEIIEQQQNFKQEMNVLEKTHQENLKKKIQMYCTICNKSFVNKIFFEKHNKTNVHLNNLKKLYRSNFPDTETKSGKQIISEVYIEPQHTGIKRERDFTETEGSVVVVSEPSDSVVVSEPPLKKVRASAGLNYLFKSEEVMNLKSEESITKHDATFTKIDEFIFMQRNYK